MDHVLLDFEDVSFFFDFEDVPVSFYFKNAHVPRIKFLGSLGLKFKGTIFFWQLSYIASKATYSVYK